MIDLHIHTTHSDGLYTISQILEMAEQKKLDYISFTDHDRVDAYKELKQINKKSLFSGKIIPGCEIRFVYKKNQYEVLCYGYDYEKLSKSYWVSEDCFEKLKKDVLKYCNKKAKDLGFVYNNVEYSKDVKPERLFYFELEKHKENLPIFKKYKINHAGEFYRKLLARPSSPMFYDCVDYALDFDGAVDLIHECGGIAILAHPFGVYDIENPEEVIDELLSKNKLDGLECCHANITKEQSKYLLDLCKKHNLISTGGSDYHGYDGQYFAKWDFGTKDIETSLIEKLLNKIDRTKIID